VLRGQQVPTQKPILELNLDHHMIKHLKEEQDPTRFEDWSRILLDQAILAEDGQLEDPASFVHRFNKLLLALTER
jgi:molecular chaperone HtpG